MPEFSHAGGVVVRTGAGRTRFLIVQASRNPDHWVLPKGHIDPGEGAAEAAVREVREETGVVAEIVCELGVDSYSLPHEDVRALYYLMRATGEVPADEDRALRWLELGDALETLSFEGSRNLVEQAAAQLAG